MAGRSRWRRRVPSNPRRRPVSKSPGLTVGTRFGCFQSSKTYENMLFGPNFERFASIPFSFGAVSPRRKGSGVQEGRNRTASISHDVPSPNTSSQLSDWRLDSPFKKAVGVRNRKRNTFRTPLGRPETLEIDLDRGCFGSF